MEGVLKLVWLEGKSCCSPKQRLLQMMMFIRKFSLLLSKLEWLESENTGYLKQVPAQFQVCWVEMVTEPLAQELVWWREDGNHLIKRKRKWRLHRVLGSGPRGG